MIKDIEFEIRISKSETIFKFRNIQIQNSSPNRGRLEHWGFLSFDIVSSFEFTRLDECLCCEPSAVEPPRPTSTYKVSRFPCLTIQIELRDNRRMIAGAHLAIGGAADGFIRQGLA